MISGWRVYKAMDASATLAGDHVRTLGEPYRWDGRNEHGTYVASGLYLFRVKYPDGSEASGRLGVVR